MKSLGKLEKCFTRTFIFPAVDAFPHRIPLCHCALLRGIKESLCVQLGRIFHTNVKGLLPERQTEEAPNKVQMLN